MRIKKFQKIICLGLALLSIMVLPCYAIDFHIYNGNYNISDNIFTLESKWEYMKEDGNITNNNYIVESQYLNHKEYSEDYQVIIQSSVKKYYYIASDKRLVPYNINDSVYINYLGIEEFNYSFENQSIELPLNVYKINLTKKIYLFNNNNPNSYTYGVVLNVNNDDTNYNGIFNLYVLTPTHEAVLNITTYTNLLIQNFGKAFSFMTGSALPWVLLGISVSLVSFGVYSAKRFL